MYQSFVIQFQTSEHLGPNQARAFIDALFDLKYQKLKSFRVWKADFGDEGLRIMSKYLICENQLEVLDLLDNGITVLGCEFFGKALLNPEINLKQIKLDNNIIGTEGLKNLALGLRTMQTLDKLSLKYCNIDKNGTRYIQEIIANINSKLRSLKLQGNPLENEGTYQVLKAVRTCGESIEKINFADVKMNLLDYSKEN
jgi:Ran GTPase-activating protein (RanGAP) involved in mRNA processing and transport